MPRTLSPGGRYKAGADLERKVKAALEEVGYDVYRVAGSHSPADLIAFGERYTLLVQVKRDGYLLPKERAALWKASVKANGVAVVASWDLAVVYHHLYMVDGQRVSGRIAPDTLRPWSP